MTGGLDCLPGDRTEPTVPWWPAGYHAINSAAVELRLRRLKETHEMPTPMIYAAAQARRHRTMETLAIQSSPCEATSDDFTNAMREAGAR